jgi:hypothetical protein
VLLLLLYCLLLAAGLLLMILLLVPLLVLLPLLLQAKQGVAGGSWTACTHQAALLDVPDCHIL